LFAKATAATFFARLASSWMSHRRLEPFREVLILDQWLAAQLANKDARCVLVFTHPFLNSSGHRGRKKSKEIKNMTFLPMQRPFKLMHEGATTVLVSAHDHSLEQFKRQDPAGKPSELACARSWSAPAERSATTSTASGRKSSPRTTAMPYTRNLAIPRAGCSGSSSIYRSRYE
jgi:hypothetical protein